MIYYDTREEFREEYKAYVYERHSHLKQNTKSMYFSESFNIENTDKGFDFWEVICDRELVDKAKESIIDFWNMWSNFHSEDPSNINYSTYISSLERIFEFVLNHDSWHERIVRESREVNGIIVDTIVESKELMDNQIQKNLTEKLGGYNEKIENQINSFRYLRGTIDDLDFLCSDTIELFLDRFNGNELDSALMRVKEYIIKKYQTSYYQFKYLIEKMDRYSKKRESNISFPEDMLKGYNIFPIYNIENMVWLIFSANFKENTVWSTNDTKLKLRLNAIPKGAKIVFVEEISINDEMIRFFDSGLKIKKYGELVENRLDGHSLRIKWLQEDLNKIWYYDTFSGDLSIVEGKTQDKRNFIAFLNGKEDQDIDRYIRKFGKKQSKADQITSTTDNIDDGSKLLENPYIKKDFLEEVFLDAIEYDKLENLLSVKQNIILQGAPGVGKTYMAKRLAYSLIGSVNNEYVLQLQFHQSYSYEDLIMGYRPTETHFELVEGPFYEFCRKAIDDSENDYYVIIDEINRGNVSKIFGELLMLIESDKRGEEHAIKLMYSNEDFFIPSNLYIIGMMNTADRSLAIIDYALRRRFAFYSMKPAFDNPRFVQTLKDSGNQKLEKLVEGIKVINKEIREDDSLGVGFEIGHSYFTKNFVVKDAHVNNILDYEIEPLLREYWYDNEEKVNGLLRMLKGKINE